MGQNRELSRFPNAITVLDNGNVGIGTTNPGTTLDVTGTGRFSSSVTASGSFISNVTNGYGLRLNRAAVTNFNGISHATGGTERWFVGMRENLSSNNYVIYNETTGADVITLSSSNNNVGIGTSSPLTRLDCQISSTGTVTENAAFRDSSVNGNALQIFNGNNESRIRAVYYGNASDQNITFWTITAGGNQGERMRIASGGQVQRHNQPSFLAYSTGFTVTGGSWYNISNAMTSEQYDVTNNYSGGRFTAPVAGRYLFYFGGYSLIASNGERYAVSFTVNGGGVFYISGSNYCIADTPLSGASIIYNLAANDYVEMSAFSAVTGTWGAGYHGVWWGGYML